MKYSIYLAGPITGLVYKDTIGWRDYVQSQIDKSIITYSPMRGKSIIEAKIGVGGRVGDSYEELPIATSKAINTRDYFDVRRVDALLVNFLGAEKVSIGTVMEIAWARAFNKPVVCVMEENNIHRHSMLEYACGYIVDNLDEGITLTEALLLPNPKLFTPLEGEHLSKINELHSNF